MFKPIQVMDMDSFLCPNIYCSALVVALTFCSFWPLALSHWCIYHRKSAEQIVKTWDKQFHSSGKEQQVPFLYLANDILQNSKHNGTEFVEEFWKVLPGALKNVTENGDDRGKKAASRLVSITYRYYELGQLANPFSYILSG
jgi:regulator of Ty1 transposition protein 103